MNVVDIINIFSNLAFPIACCCFLFWQNSKFQAQHEKENEKWEQAVNKLNDKWAEVYKEDSTKWTELVVNNTKAIDNLSDRLDGLEREIREMRLGGRGNDRVVS